jgi:hypothetical protein
VIGNINHPASLIVVLLMLATVASSQVKVTVDRNTGRAATRDFKFKSVSSPAKDHAAAHARLSLVVGQRDPNGAGLNALTDGLLPASEDDPAANFFFNADTDGGRFLMDLGGVIEVSQVNTYSWHSESRAPQVYNLYASDGSDPKFNPRPDANTDPSACGWKLIATVDTRPKQGEVGGQYGVSIADSTGALGKYRYLLFDCVETETDDPWGNTFYSEIDVVAKK